MAEIIYGERIGKQGQLAPGCSAWVMEPMTHKVLLVQRADDQRWAVPGGYMEPGESVTEACEREVLEETGIQVKATQLIAVYTNPNMLLKYTDGNKWQIVVLHFAAEYLSGEPKTSDETTAVGYFSQNELTGMNIGTFDRQRLADGFNFQGSTFVRNHIRI